MEPLPTLSSLDKEQLQELLKELYGKACILFGEAFDVQLTVKVNDMNGKFVIPKLKKVRHQHVVEEEQ